MRGDTLVSCARPRSRARPFRSSARGVAKSRLLVLPRGAVEREGTSQKTTSRNEFSHFVYQHYHITDFWRILYNK